MKDRAIDLVTSRSAAIDGVNLLREYVQSRMLGVLQETGAFMPWAFMGGTALRFLYGVPRFSEDLDFTVERDVAFPPFADTIRTVVRVLDREGYSVRPKINESTVVAKAMLGLIGLEYDAGLTPHEDKTLWVKIELDTNPPAGAGLDVSLVDRFGLLRLQHHDLPSLFAGKIAAVLAREYAKGRDYYDLMWYLTRPDGIEPNAVLLRNALLQTAPELADDAEASWRDVLKARFTEADWADIRRDVAPFLEQPREVELLTPETFQRLFGS